MIQDLIGKTIFIDTAPLIYFIEGHTEFQPTLRQLFTAVDSEECSLISSTITVLEVLVKPLRENRIDLVDIYTGILMNSKGIEIYDLTIAVAKQAAGLRAKYNLRTPDSIQVATALVFGAEIFLTNDIRLQSVSEVDILPLTTLT